MKTVAQQIEFSRHPLSSAFPSMGDAEFLLLIKDIAAHGLIEPVIIMDGMILDGWHRYNACIESGTECTFSEFDAGDPADWVWSKNGPRRNMTASQRAASIVKISEWRESGDRGKSSATVAELAGKPLNKPTSADMAKKAGVSTKTVDLAKAAERAGKGDDVLAGKVSASAATAKPKPVATKAETPPATPDTETQELRDHIIALEAVNKELIDENTSIGSAFDADDKLSAMATENKKLRELNRVLNERVQSLQGENNEAKRAAKTWMAKFTKLEKATKNG